MRKALTITAVALLTTLSACGGQTDGSGGSSGNDTEEHALKPINSVSALVKQASGSAEKKRSMTFTTNFSGGPAALSGMSNTCRVDITKSMMACDGASKMVMTGDAMYIKSPKPNGKPWRKISFRSDGPMSQIMAKMSSFKKFTEFKTMLPSGATITNTEKTEVNGTPATRYKLTVDVSEAPVTNNQIAQFGRDIMRKNGIAELHPTIWVSAEGLPLKFEQTNPAMTVKGKKIPKMTVSVTYSNWGEPVDITVPPASKVGEGMPMPRIPNAPQQPN